MSKRGLAVPFAVSVLLCCLAVPSFSESQARIVRLSQVDGDVQIDRNTGQGYEKAFINLPVTQGTKLRTGSDARAEIEFEDGSTLRITPGSLVEFRELGRRDTGAQVSNLVLQEGTAYLNFKGNKEQEFTLNFGRESLTFTKPAHLRVELKHANATVAVFKGDVEVNGLSGKVELEKKHSATFDLAGNVPYAVANNLEPDPYDDWDQQQEKYHQQYSLNASSGHWDFFYGSSDLNYYGSFYNMPGYGMMWQPYLTGAGWDPFMDGTWAWYPGTGYAWVSAYPWGWAPYRYGSWTYLPTYGWFWRPGNPLMGWNAVPRVVNAPRNFVAPRPPSTPGQTLLVNRSTPAGTVAAVQNGSQVRAGSAGLGIARGSVRNLGKISQQVERTASPATMQSPSASVLRAPPASSRVSPVLTGPSLHAGAPSHSSAPSGTASAGVGSGAPSAAHSSHSAPR